MNTALRLSHNSTTARSAENRSIANSVGQQKTLSISKSVITDNRQNFVSQRIVQLHADQKPVFQLNRKKRKREKDNEEVEFKKKRKLLKPHYLDAHFSFSLEDDPEYEVYTNHIDNLIDDLDIDRQELEMYMRKDIQGRTYYKHKNVQKMILAKKRSITEKVGELNASQFMAKNFPNHSLILGYGKGTGFDQVYENGDEIMIVEAKGPRAKLGSSARKGNQMSKSWVLMTASGMSNKRVKRKIKRAQRLKKLKGVVITSTNTGKPPKRGLFYDYS